MTCSESRSENDCASENLVWEVCKPCASVNRFAKSGGNETGGWRTQYLTMLGERLGSAHAFVLRNERSSFSFIAGIAFSMIAIWFSTEGSISTIPATLFRWRLAKRRKL